MKGLISFIVVLSFLLGGCGGEDKPKADASRKGDSEFVIRITGTDGLRFEGYHSVVTSKGDSISNDIEGIVPAEYHPSEKGIVGICHATKTSEPGTLRIEVEKTATGGAGGAEVWSPGGGGTAICD
jgi:hypothetical protein